jgi:hypothetical protein
MLRPGRTCGREPANAGYRLPAIVPLMPAIVMPAIVWVSAGEGWTRVADPMPQVRFVPEWSVVEDPGTLTGVDIRRAALVRSEVRATPGSRPATFLRDEPGRMLIQVSAPGRALLVTTEAYGRGSTATGPAGTTALQLLPVYGDYLGVVVEPGNCQLSLVFKPRSLRVGWYVSLSGLILTGIVTAVASRIDRSRIPHAIKVGVV